MKKRKSLATNKESTQKRKAIIISCAAIGLIGAAFAIALPLALCSGNNKKLVSDGHVVLCETDKMVESKLYHPDTPVEFIVVSPYNESIADAKINWSYKKIDDQSNKDSTTFIDVKSLYDAASNTWKITVTPIMDQDQVIRGNFNFWIECGIHRSNEISSEYWSIPKLIEVGQSRIVIRDDRDAQEVVNYLTKPNVAPYNKTQTNSYNGAISSLKFSYTDFINCLMGSDKCPLDLPDGVELAPNQPNNIIKKEQQVNDAVLIPAPIHRDPPSPNESGANYGIGLQTLYWTNDQVWVDLVYGAAWNVLVEKARWTDLDFKSNVSPANHLETIFTNLPTITLDHWIGPYDAPLEVVETLPIHRGADPFDSTLAHNTRTVNDLLENDTVGIFEEALEKKLRGFFRSYGYNFGGNFTPHAPSGCNSYLGLGRTVDNYIYFYSIDGDYDGSLISNKGFVMNGWGSSYFTRNSLSLDLAGLTMTLDFTEKLWMPSYWYHDYDRLDDNTPILYPTFIDGDF